MQTTSFYPLQSNLIEILPALYAAKPQRPLPLYATSQSTVYFQGTLMGQTLKIWDKACKVILPVNDTSIDRTLTLILTTCFDDAVHKVYDGRQLRIWNHMRQLDRIWNNRDFTKHRGNYDNYLKKELNGSVESPSLYLDNFDKRAFDIQTEQQERNHRLMIIHFRHATDNFWPLFITQTNQEMIRLRQPLEHYLNRFSTLKDPVIRKAIKKEYRWIKMEGVMQQSIPLEQISKLKHLDDLSSKEKKLLKKWVEHLNLFQQSLPLHLVWNVFQEMIEIIQLQGSSSLSMQDLLAWLNKEGCLIFSQEDGPHMDWRESLKSGDTIECNGLQLVLDLEMPTEKFIDDTYKIFTLKNSDHVVKIAKNRFLLFLQENQSNDEEEHWGVRYVETISTLTDDTGMFIHGLDSQGRCVVVEKLIPTFKERVWTSTTVKLTDEDRFIALSFANLIFCLSEWKGTVQNLSIEHLMQNKQGILKSTRLLKKGPPNYIEWENDCEKAAKGNRYIMHFLMGVSKLIEHPIAIFFQEVVEHAFKTGEIDLIGKFPPMGHRQDYYELHAKDICAQALELRNKCIKNTVALLRKTEKYSYKNERIVGKAVGDKLALLYHLSPTPGKISPDLEKRFMESLKKGYHPLIEFDSVAELYYQEQHDEMMQLNVVS